MELILKTSVVSTAVMVVYIVLCVGTREDFGNQGHGNMAMACQ